MKYRELFTLSPAFCMYNGAAVISQNEHRIRFGLVKPDDTELRLRLFHAFSFYLRNENNVREADVSFLSITRQQLLRSVSLLYGQQRVGCGIQPEMTVESQKEETAAAILLLDSLLSEAQAIKATDIHIERNAVRFRLNGRLLFHMMLQKQRCRELILRIKLLSGMNILEKRQSQDGHFTTGKDKSLFVRVSCMNIIASDGCFDGDESVVLRLLDSRRIVPDIFRLGFSTVQIESLKMWCKIPHGLILICGATGSGKSTTATALLSEIVRNESNRKKIISLEDPVEYVLPGVTQIQVSDFGVNNFDTVLRCVFRQDPDVLFIGEIRDGITAKTAIQAALTGHLVFATLHTSGVNEALLRLKSLGADEILAKTVLRGVITQSLTYERNETILKATLECFGRLPTSKRNDVLLLSPPQGMTDVRESVV